jgi:hypothetical protein
MKRSFFVLLLLLFSAVLPAQQPAQPAQPDSGDSNPLDPQFVPSFPDIQGDEATQANEATIDFKGAGFGAGLGIVVDVEKGRVSDAEVVNGVVRVKKDDDLGPRVVLNLHYFFSGACDPDPSTGKARVDKWCRKAIVNGDEVAIPMRGWGPFVAVQPGTGEAIQAVGGGLLWGWRRHPDKPDSFNVGFGALVDQNVKVLGDGIKENKPLPNGETEIRFKETSRWGLLLMASWAF